MTEKQQRILEGNLRVGLTDLYNQVAHTTQELNEKYKELRRAVSEEIKIDLLRTNCDYLNWEYLSCWREMNEDEVREFRDYIRWDLLKNYQLEHLSLDFLREMDEYLN